MMEKFEKENWVSVGTKVFTSKRTVAEVSEDGISTVQAEKNASLMSDSPEMVKALRDVYNDVWRLLNEDIDRGNHFSSEFLRDMSSAITKAGFYSQKHLPPKIKINEKA